MMGGLAISKDYMDRMGALCRDLQIGLHIDGARIYNAAQTLDNMPLSDLCQAVDSVSTCLSKGLGVLNVLVGDEEFIRLARRARKRCGGGMRQAGVIAATGLYALPNKVERLRDDHVRAKRLADELVRGGFRLARPVATNLVYFAPPEDAGVSKLDFGRRLDLTMSKTSNAASTLCLSTC